MKETVGLASFEGFPLQCGVTTRHFPLQVVQTREFAEGQKLFTLGHTLLGVRPGGWSVAEQPHGDTIAFVDEETVPSPSKMIVIEGADGLVTRRPGQVLSILTADCLPIFFYLEDPSSVGLIHAGWRSSAKGIAAKAVSTLRDRFNVPARDLYATFGPSIRGCCYQVEEHFREFFPETLEKRGGHFYLDLMKENRQQLLKAGLLSERLGDAGPCCACHLEDFYSYRKEGDHAYRMLSWIALS